MKMNNSQPFIITIGGKKDLISPDLTFFSMQDEQQEQCVTATCSMNTLAFTDGFGQVCKMKQLYLLLCRFERYIIKESAFIRAEEIRSF